MSLLERLKASGSVQAAQLSESIFYQDKVYYPTPIPIINTAFSGFIDGGLVTGLTMFAGPSKHFKSLLGLICVKAYMDHFKDAVCLFYDSEFGIPKDYSESVGIDSTRVLHIPIMHIEQLKFDLSKRLEEIKRGDHVIIFVDSIGNLASKKEVEDALDEKSVADMTRAKALKSLFRIITPHLTMKDIPAIFINHTYKEISLFPKDIVGGGTGSYYSANQIFIISRSQEKDSEGVVGYKFTLNVEKSRFVKEKSKLSFQVFFEGGINPFSGLLDLALESGHVVNPKKGWYSIAGDTKNYREKDTNTFEFWNPIVSDESFKSFVHDRYALSSNSMFGSFEEKEDD